MYPNLMVNIYGPFMDTNLVLPDGPERCTVKFDYWLEHSLCQDKDFIADSLSSSDQVCPVLLLLLVAESCGNI